MLVLPLYTVGQFPSLQPVSTPFFSPFTFNPAVAGAKDHSGINLISAIYKNASAQLISADTRFAKNLPVYSFSDENKEFRNWGSGLSLYHSQLDSFRSISGNAALSCHIPLNKRQLSFLSFGAAAKTFFFKGDFPISEDSIFMEPLTDDKHFDFDLGVYFYSAIFHGGFSVINFKGTKIESDSTGLEIHPRGLQYFANSGIKLLFSRSWNIVFEPGIIMHTHDLSIQNIEEKIHPILKLYLKDFCLGYYEKDQSKFSFFFEYRYPALFLSAYFDLPKKSAYYKKEPTIELAAGIKLGRPKKRAVEHSRW